MSSTESLNWRYATKKFDNSRKLSDEQLDSLKQAFNLTPTSYGIQAMKMLIITDKKTKQDMVSMCYGQLQVKDASHVLVLAIHDEVTEKDIDAHFDNVVSIRGTSEDILSKYRKELKDFVNSRTQKELENWCINQAYIALGNLMTVCAVEQIDSCPMEGFIPEKVDELLSLKELNLKSVLLLPVGYRSKDDMFAELKKVRKDIKETIIDL